MSTAYRIEILDDLEDGASPLFVIRHEAKDDADAYVSAVALVQELSDPRMKGWRLVTISGHEYGSTPSLAVSGTVGTPRP